MPTVTEQRQPPRNRAELLAAIQARWNACVDLIDDLTDDQWMGRTDERGWTVKDHVAHVATWENVVIEIFRVGAPQYVTLQMSEAEWATGGIEGADAMIHARKAGLSVRRVRNNRDATHARVVTILRDLPEDDVHRPFSDFGAVDSGRSVLVEMTANLIDRYDALCAAITALVDTDDAESAETSAAGA